MNQEAKGQKKAQEEKTQGIAMKRAGRPEEIGKLAVFLVFFRFRLCHGLYLFFMDGGLMRLVGQRA